MAVATYYQANKTAVDARRRKHKERSRRFVLRVKRLLHCAACGENHHPAAMDFHHLIPADKDRSLSELVRANASLSRIKAEMRKCVPVCANCHRVFEASESPESHDRRRVTEL